MQAKPTKEELESLIKHENTMLIEDRIETIIKEEPVELLPSDDIYQNTKPSLLGKRLREEENKEGETAKDDDSTDYDDDNSNDSYDDDNDDEDEPVRDFCRPGCWICQKNLEEEQESKKLMYNRISPKRVRTV